jgi:proline iminopeptidase
VSTLTAGGLRLRATSSLPLPARVALGAALPALAALALVLVSPRGAVDAATGILAIATGLAAGLAAGAVLRSRWALLLAPTAFALVVELRWIPLEGPSVDAPRFDNGYAVLALLLGRGALGLLAFLPLLVGVSLALAALHRRRPGIPAIVGVLAVAALVVAVARPASTPPLPGGIANLERIELGGSEQWLQIRGASEELPVLLYLSGGPGQSDMPQVRATWADLEDDFVIVNLDERGVGKAYASIDPTGTLTLEAAVDDVIELTNVLRARFDEDKVYLVGESWGTLLGVLAVQRAPELFHAYVGSGQMVDVAETDRLLYDDMLAYAERTGDEAAAATMRGYGPPPYADVFANAYVMGYYDRLAGDYDVPAYAVDRAERFGYGPFGHVSAAPGARPAARRDAARGAGLARPGPPRAARPHGARAAVARRPRRAGEEPDLVRARRARDGVRGVPALRGAADGGGPAGHLRCAAVSAPLRLVPFADEHLDAAASLLAARHRRHREAEPLLPEADARARLESEWGADGASGTIAYRGDEPAGYLVARPVPAGAGTWMFAGIGGHAVAGDRELARDLYAAAAGPWAEAGHLHHAVFVPWHDAELVDAWFRLTFGASAAPAMRETGPQPPVDAGVVVRPGAPGDLEATARLDRAMQGATRPAPSFSRSRRSRTRSSSRSGAAPGTRTCSRASWPSATAPGRPSRGSRR